MLRMPSAIELWWRTRSVGGAGTPDTQAGTHWHSRDRTQVLICIIMMHNYYQSENIL